MKTYLEQAEIDNLENNANNLRDKILIRLLFHLGCRVSEAMAIGVDDIDFENGTIRIRHLKHKVKYACPECSVKLAACHTYCPGCGVKITGAQKKEIENHRQRNVPIDDKTLKILMEYIENKGPVNKNGKNLIFGINRHRAWQIIKECADRAGLPKLINMETGKVHNVSPHRLRDAFAVHAVKHDDSGDGLRMLQEHLGHASFNTTARYVKISGEEQKQWYDKLWEDNRQR
jgi:integrase/recombinase XerD